MPLKPGIVRATLAVPLLIASALSAAASPWTPQNSAWNVNLNPGSNPANYYGGWSGHTYFPSPDDWRKVPVYQFITDRFCDGEPANNELAYPGYDLRDVGARHGGDFLGVRDRLEYIRALGYKAIWISPVFQNRTNSYHGYGQIDFTLLDQRFGTVEDFRAMVAKAHSLGLYVIVDIVVNHLENLYYFEGHPNDGAPFRLHTGEYQLFPRTPGETYVDFPVDNTFYSTGTYCDVFGDDGYRPRGQRQRLVLVQRPASQRRSGRLRRPLAESSRQDLRRPGRPAHHPSPRAGQDHRHDQGADLHVRH